MRFQVRHPRANARGQPAPPAPGAAPVAPLALATAAAKAVAAPARHTAPATANGSRDDRKAKGQARAKLADRTRPLRNELAQIDQRLARLVTERSEHEAALAAATLAPADIADAGRQLAHIGAEVAMLEERWLELHSELEAIATAS
jgi:ATP-binding cassette subfamily F protein 3